MFTFWVQSHLYSWYLLVSFKALFTWMCPVKVKLHLSLENNGHFALELAWWIHPCSPQARLPTPSTDAPRLTMGVHLNKHTQPLTIHPLETCSEHLVSLHWAGSSDHPFYSKAVTLSGNLLNATLLEKNRMIGWDLLYHPKVKKSQVRPSEVWNYPDANQWLQTICIPLSVLQTDF